MEVGQMRSREYGLDLLKIFACCAVVAIHTVNGTLGLVNRLIQMATVLAIPLFFAINGYLMLQKQHVSYQYVGKRIVRIIGICFGWELLYSIAVFCYYRETRNFLQSLMLDFVQKGCFFHFWFLGALMIIYLALPLMKSLQVRYPKWYFRLTVLLGIICAAVDLVQFLLKVQFINQVIQTFRLWMWLFYFMAGGLVASQKSRIERWIKKHHIWYAAATLTALTAMYGWLWCSRQLAFGYLDVAGFYGALPVIACVLLLMGGAATTHFPGNEACQRLSATTMGVYIVHPFILSVWVKFLPIVNERPILNLVYWIGVIVCSEVAVLIIRKIPLVRELTHI